VPPAYRVEHRPVAERELEQLPRAAQVRVIEALVRLSFRPLGGDRLLDVRQLRDAPGLWRLSVAGWRVFYRVDGQVVSIVGYRPRTSSTYSDLRKLPK
jgi:mRNA-degrading endonuclease RelE of RelBE toxin-antitoxin system